MGEVGGGAEVLVRAGSGVDGDVEAGRFGGGVWLVGVAWLRGGVWLVAAGEGDRTGAGALALGVRVGLIPARWYGPCQLS